MKTRGTLRRAFKPTVTIPMHNRTKALSIPGMLLFDKIDKFIEAARLPSTEVRTLVVTPSTLTQFAGIVAMQYE